jgi:hypothetical protein
MHYQPISYPNNKAVIASWISRRGVYSGRKIPRSIWNPWSVPVVPRKTMQNHRSLRETMKKSACHAMNARFECVFFSSSVRAHNG